MQGPGHAVAPKRDDRLCTQKVVAKLTLNLCNFLVFELIFCSLGGQLEGPGAVLAAMFAQLSPKAWPEAAMGDILSDLGTQCWNFGGQMHARWKPESMQTRSIKQCENQMDFRCVLKWILMFLGWQNEVQIKGKRSQTCHAYRKAGITNLLLFVMKIIRVRRRHFARHMC